MRISVFLIRRCLLCALMLTTHAQSLAMSITYLSGSDRASTPPANALIVAHNEAVFSDLVSNPLIASLIPGDRSLLAAAAGYLSPSREAGSSTEVI